MMSLMSIVVVLLALYSKSIAKILFYKMVLVRFNIIQRKNTKMKMKGLTNANNEKPTKMINKKHSEYIRVIIVHISIYDMATAAQHCYALQIRWVQSKHVTYVFKKCIK